MTSREADTLQQRADTAQQRADNPPTKAETLDQLRARWADGLVSKNSINPATGKPYTHEEALATVGPLAKMGAEAHDAYHEWLASHVGGTYDDFLKDTAAIKGDSAKKSGLGTYAMVRLMDMAYKDNPELLTLMPQILKQVGIEAPADIGEKSKEALPTNEKGEPIGTAMPGAPTGATRNRGQLAEGMIAEIPNVKKNIADLGDQLGPALGRWNEFMTGKIGAGDPRFEQLRTNMQLMTSGAAKMHLNSVRAVEEFNKLASAGKMTPEVLNAFIDTVGEWAGTYAKQGRGKPAGKSDAAPGAGVGSSTKAKVLVEGKDF